MDLVDFGNSPVAVDDQTDLDGIEYSFAGEAVETKIVAAFCDLDCVAALLAVVAVAVEVFATIYAGKKGDEKRNSMNIQFDSSHYYKL